ncbi:ABC transporter permease subunit [bacterium]|nr:ABC transporter permease subunit [bacterium]
MPIYEETYRPWHGHTVTHPKTGWVIAKTGFRLLWKRSMILFLVMANLNFVVRAVQIYLVSRTGSLSKALPNAGMFDINAGFFLSFIKGQIFWFIIIMIFAGAGLIANDRKFKALSIYFSKPVNFWDYILGKFSVMAGYGILVTLIPGWLLFLTAVMLGKDSSVFSQFWWVPLSMLAAVIILISTWGTVVLALSAISRSTRTAAILSFGVFLFPELIRAILSRIPSIGLFSLQAVTRQIMAAVFGQRLPYDFSVWLGAILIICITVLALFVIRWRVRPTEVVG